MGAPTNSERGLPAQIAPDDPDFQAWARQHGHPIQGSTPYSEVLQLIADYRHAKEAEAANSYRRKAVEDEDARLETARDKRAERLQLREAIAKALNFQDATLEQNARYAVNAAKQIQGFLQGQYWESDRHRWAFERYFLRYYAIAFGGHEPSFEELLTDVVREEQIYLAEMRRRERAAQRAKFGHSVLVYAETRPLNPVRNFDPGIADMHVETAASSPQYVDRISNYDFDSVHGLKLEYSDGHSLTIPLSKELIFGESLPPDARALFARRHTASGRLVPFVVYGNEVRGHFGDIDLQALPEATLALLGTPRFDPNITPTILSLFSQDKVLLDVAQGLLKVTAIMSAGKALPLGAPAAAGTGTLAASAGVRAYGLASSAGTAVLEETTFAVSQWGVSMTSASYVATTLASRLYTFYLVNAVTVNLTVVVGTEVVVNFAGGDTGGVSAGDSLTFAVAEGENIAKEARVLVDEGKVLIAEAKSIGAERQILQTRKRNWTAVETEVEAVEKGGKVRLRITKTTPIDEQKAKAEFEAGKKVIGKEKAGSKAGRGTADRMLPTRDLGAGRSPIRRVRRLSGHPNRRSRWC